VLWILLQKSELYKQNWNAIICTSQTVHLWVRLRFAPFKKCTNHKLTDTLRHIQSQVFEQVKNLLMPVRLEQSYQHIKIISILQPPNTQNLSRTHVEFVVYTNMLFQNVDHMRRYVAEQTNRHTSCKISLDKRTYNFEWTALVDWNSYSCPTTDPFICVSCQTYKPSCTGIQKYVVSNMNTTHKITPFWLFQMSFSNNLHVWPIHFDLTDYIPNLNDLNEQATEYITGSNCSKQTVNQNVSEQDIHIIKSSLLVVFRLLDIPIESSTANMQVNIQNEQYILIKVNSIDYHCDKCVLSHEVDIALTKRYELKLRCASFVCSENKPKIHVYSLLSHLKNCKVNDVATILEKYIS